jgi:hypothetical protein
VFFGTSQSRTWQVVLSGIGLSGGGAVCCSPAQITMPWLAGFISSLFVVMPTKFAVLFTFANIFAIARWGPADCLITWSTSLQHQLQSAQQPAHSIAYTVSVGVASAYGRLTSSHCCSTMFLSGPLTHAKKMMEKGRWGTHQAARSTSPVYCRIVSLQLQG